MQGMAKWRYTLKQKPHLKKYLQTLILSQAYPYNVKSASEM